MKARKLVVLFALCLVVAILLPLTVLAAPELQPKIPHSIDGRANCIGCHAVGGAGAGAPGGTGMPTNHQGRTAEMCQGCHQLASAVPASSSSGTAAGGTSSSSSSSSSASSSTTQQTSASSSQAPQAQQQPAQQSEKLPTAGENDFQFVTIAIAAVVLVFGGFAMRRLVATR